MVGIYLFCTGEYASLAEDFLKTLYRWLPNEEKVVCLLSDDETYKDFKDENIRVEFHHTEHYPWPVITLYKFYLMKKYKVKGARGHFYFNANVVFTEECNTFDWSTFNSNIIIVSQHAAYDINRTDYTQTAAFYLPEICFNDICNEYSRRVNVYTQKLLGIPICHDETIFNNMLLKECLFPFEWFPNDKGCRWICYSKSPIITKGLCFLRDKDFQQRTKHDF